MNTTLLIRFVAVSLLGAGLASCGGKSSPHSTSSYSAADQVAAEYVVVTVKMTEDDIEVTGSQLIRGPQKANSALPDIHVRPSAGGNVIGEYATTDPRIRRRDGEEWEVAESAETLIFVPLSSLVDKVLIEPVADRVHIATAGGSFDPRPWAAQACEAEPATFTQCAALLGLVASGAIVLP